MSFSLVQTHLSVFGPPTLGFDQEYMCLMEAKLPRKAFQKFRSQTPVSDLPAGLSEVLPGTLHSQDVENFGNAGLSGL